MTELDTHDFTPGGEHIAQRRPIKGGSIWSAHQFGMTYIDIGDIKGHPGVRVRGSGGGRGVLGDRYAYEVLELQQLY